MATNVTEKDKTLNEIIDWAKSRCHEAALSRFDVRRKSDRDFYDGQVNAFHEILELCCSMLGYSGSMPSEVPQSKRGREGIVMWFKRKYNEYGCPMCGRLPVIKAWQTEKYHESRKVRTTLTVYRLQCPRGHISTSWFSHAALASRQWKELVDEYKGKDTK